MAAKSIGKLRISTSCHNCVEKCCSQPYDWVYLTQAEIEQIEKSSPKGRETFVEERLNEESGLTFRRLMLPCPFLETATGKCTIYEGRPLVCRLYPFYPEALTGDLALIPGQCGENLHIHDGTDGAGWRIQDYDEEIREWFAALWQEARAAAALHLTSAPGATTRTEGSP